MLVAARVALSTVWLLAAGLLMTSMRAVLDADRSFPARNIAVAAMDNPGTFRTLQESVKITFAASWRC